MGRMIVRTVDRSVYRSWCNQDGERGQRVIHGVCRYRLWTNYRWRNTWTPLVLYQCGGGNNVDRFRLEETRWIHGYDFIVRWFLERYRPLPDISLCCHKNKTKTCTLFTVQEKKKGTRLDRAVHTVVST